MSRYFNDAGEPMMTHAQARFEAELDEMSAMEARLEEPGDEDAYELFETCPECGYEEGSDGYGCNNCPECGTRMEVREVPRRRPEPSDCRVP